MGKPERSCCQSDAKAHIKSPTGTAVDAAERRTTNRRKISKRQRNVFRKMFKLRCQEFEEAPLIGFRGSLTSISDEMEGREAD